MERKHAVLLLVLTAFFWSLGGLMIKKVDLHPMAIAGWRSAIASVFLLVWNRRRLTWSWPLVAGGVAYAANMFSFVSATKLTTAANAILLQYTAPAYVAVIGIWFLKEMPRGIDWLSVGFTMGGMVLFFMDRLTFNGLWGNLLGVMAGITFAGIILSLRKLKDGSALDSVILGNLLTALVALPLIAGKMPAPSDWTWLILMGTVQTALPYILAAVALRYVTAMEGVLIPMIEPLLNPLWALIFLAEVPGVWALVGGGVILGAVTMRAVAGGRAPRPAAGR
jgi:drug/metabolite transporter (DMT)-like permease